MAKLYFYYGAMGSSKTADALMTVYNYRERGQRALLAKSELDTRDGATKIRSRIGLESECILLRKLLTLSKAELQMYDVIVVDEAQFASEAEIDALSDIVDFYDIPVICYGLRTDFQSNLFTGSKRLLEIADEIKEKKTMCWCGKKATYNARYNKDGIIKDGEQIVLGSNSNYTSLCRKHYKLGVLTKPRDILPICK